MKETSSKKTQSFNDLAAAGVKVEYQLKNGWRLRPHQIEHPTGVSETVPDQSYKIGDLIKKFASHVDPGVSKIANYNGEEEEVDFDDEDYSQILRADIHEQENLAKEKTARQKFLLEQMEAKKMELKKEQKQAEKKPDLTKEIEGKKEA